MVDETAKAPTSPAEITRLVTENLDLVDLIARSTQRQIGHASYEELVASGREGLLQAARSFDPARGVRFRHYAAMRVRGAMIDAMRSAMPISRYAYQKLRALERAESAREALVEEDEAKPPATPEEADARLADHLAQAATAMAMSFLATIPNGNLDRVASPTHNPEELATSAELLEQIQEAIAKRPEAEQHLVRRHYFDDVPLDEAGRELGLSKSWASRLHARAITGIARFVNRPRPPPR